MKWTLSILVVVAALAGQLKNGVARAGQARDIGFLETHEWDRTKKVTIEGFITKLEMGKSNSSSQIGLNVKNPDGRITNWTVAGPSPAQLNNSVLGQLLKIGASLKVTGAPPKDPPKSSTTTEWFGKERLYGTTFTIADGREFEFPLQ